MSNRLNIILDLRSEVTEELIRPVDLFLEIFFGASDCVEGFGTEFIEVIFEADIFAFEVFKIFSICLNASLLLLCDFLAERDLSVCV